MKLNLLPVTVRKGAKSRTAWVVFALLVLFGAGAMAEMIIKSTADDRQAKQDVADARPKADEAYNYSTAADQIMLKAAGELRNIGLAQLMVQHNAVYPAAYEDLFKFIPPFYRLISISATPIDATSCTVTMQGTLTTYQQYADLMLALMRNPRVVSVSRSGYNWSEEEVPALSADDQVGKQRKPGAAPIPDDPLARLTYFENTATPPAGYTGQGNFGAGPDVTKTTVPGDSLVTVTLVATYPLQTPDPRATLAASGASTAAGGGAPSVAPTTATGPTGVPTPVGAGGARGPSAAPPSGTGKGKGSDEGD